MDEKKKSTTPEERLELWADLVRLVSDDLPAVNKDQFIAMCLEAYQENAFDDQYENCFFVNEKYADKRWKKIINEAASGSDGVFVKYVRERVGGSFQGQWQKVNKYQYITQMQSEANGLSTRVENYNYNRELADKRWKNLQLPLFEVKQIPATV